MTPVMCQVQHNPPHSYGDCFRACVASILDRSPDTVPHFYHDGGSGDVMADKMRVVEWLASQGYAPFYTYYDGSAVRYEILEMMGENAPTAHYMLFGQTGDGGNHVVVCRGSAIVHNPCAGAEIVRCTSAGVWIAMGICLA